MNVLLIVVIYTVSKTYFITQVEVSSQKHTQVEVRNELLFRSIKCENWYLFAHGLPLELGSVIHFHATVFNTNHALCSPHGQLYMCVL